MPSDNVGESWEISACCNKISVVENGDLAGKTLQDLLESFGKEIMGEKYAAHAQKSFPLLVKIIDANERLSIQVHPDDAGVGLAEGQNGKTEAWYVLWAKKDAKIIYGLNPDVSREGFAQAVRAGSVMDIVRSVSVAQGDVIYVPAGMVHALLEGVIVYEVQQSSDITYRLYDYGRVDKYGKKRELHIEKAIEAVRLDSGEIENFKNRVLHSPYFDLAEISTEGITSVNLNNGCMILFIIAGSGEIRWQDGSLTVQSGNTILVPACMGQFDIKGKMSALRITMPQDKTSD